MTAFAPQRVRPRPKPDREATRRMIRDIAIEEKVDPALAEATFGQESGYRQSAVSKKGARGIAQIMPGTAVELARELKTTPEKVLRDPETNVRGGLRYLRHGLEDGVKKGVADPVAHALIRYNSGRDSTKVKFRDLPRETRNYVPAIKARREQLLRMAQQLAAAPAATPATTQAPSVSPPATPAPPAPASTAPQLPAASPALSLPAPAPANVSVSPASLAQADLSLQQQAKALTQGATPSEMLPVEQPAPMQADTRVSQEAKLAAQSEAIPRVRLPRVSLPKGAPAPDAGRALPQSGASSPGGAPSPQSLQEKQARVKLNEIIASNGGELARQKYEQSVAEYNAAISEVNRQQGQTVPRGTSGAQGQVADPLANVPAGPPDIRGGSFVGYENSFYRSEDPERLPVQPPSEERAPGILERMEIQAGDDAKLEGDVYREWHTALKSGDYKKASLAARIYEERFPNGKYSRHVYDPVSGIGSVPFAERKMAREGAVAVNVKDLVDAGLKGEQLRAEVERRFREGLGFDAATHAAFVAAYGFDPARTSGEYSGRTFIKQSPEEFEQLVANAGEDNTLLIRVPQQTAAQIQEFFNQGRAIADPSRAQAETTVKNLSIRENLLPSWVTRIPGLEWTKAFNPKDQERIFGKAVADGTQQLAAGMAQGMAGTVGSVSKGAGVLIRELARAVGGKGTKTPISDLLIAGGDGLNNFLKRASLENTSGEGFNTFSFGQGLGSGVTFAPIGGAGKLAVGIVGALAEAGSAYDETYERLIQQGLSPEAAHRAAINAAVLATPGGLSEMAGVGGTLSRALEGGMPGAGFWRNMLGAVARESWEEGPTQERFQNRWSNAVAQVSGDPRRALSHGEATAILTGLFTGGLMGGAAHAAVGKNPERQYNRDVRTIEAFESKESSGAQITESERQAAADAYTRLHQSGTFIDAKNAPSSIFNQEAQLDSAIPEEEKPSALRAKTATATENLLRRVTGADAKQQPPDAGSIPENIPAPTDRAEAPTVGAPAAGSINTVTIPKAPQPKPGQAADRKQRVLAAVANPSQQVAYELQEEVEAEIEKLVKNYSEKPERGQLVASDLKLSADDFYGLLNRIDGADTFQEVIEILDQYKDKDADIFIPGYNWLKGYWLAGKHGHRTEAYRFPEKTKAERIASLRDARERLVKQRQNVPTTESRKGEFGLVESVARPSRDIERERANYDRRIALIDEDLKNLELEESESVERTIDQAAQAAATSPTNALPQPTEAQKEAGNYRKGHARIGGLNISIENPQGSKRRDEWPELKSHYGYIRRTEGGDGEQIDVFVKPGTADDYSGPVYVVDQTNTDGTFDEHKVMLGWDSEEAARQGYAENYTPDWKVGNIREFASVAEFKDWLKTADTTKPATETQQQRLERIRQGIRQEQQEQFDREMDYKAETSTPEFNQIAKAIEDRPDVRAILRKMRGLLERGDENEQKMEGLSRQINKLTVEEMLLRGVPVSEKLLSFFPDARKPAVEVKQAPAARQAASTLAADYNAAAGGDSNAPETENARIERRTEEFYREQLGADYDIFVAYRGDFAVLKKQAREAQQELLDNARNPENANLTGNQRVRLEQERADEIARRFGGMFTVEDGLLKIGKYRVINTYGDFDPDATQAVHRQLRKKYGVDYNFFEKITAKLRELSESKELFDYLHTKEGAAATPQSVDKPATTEPTTRITTDYAEYLALSDADKRADLDARIAAFAAGKPMTGAVYNHGHELYYTPVVPADARRAFRSDRAAFVLVEGNNALTEALTEAGKFPANGAATALEGLKAAAKPAATEPTTQERELARRLYTEMSAEALSAAPRATTENSKPGDVVFNRLTGARGRIVSATDHNMTYIVKHESGEQTGVEEYARDFATDWVLAPVASVESSRSGRRESAVQGNEGGDRVDATINSKEMARRRLVDAVESGNPRGIERAVGNAQAAGLDSDAIKQIVEAGGIKTRVETPSEPKSIKPGEFEIDADKGTVKQVPAVPPAPDAAAADESDDAFLQKLKERVAKKQQAKTRREAKRAVAEQKIVEADDEIKSLLGQLSTASKKHHGGPASDEELMLVVKLMRAYAKKGIQQFKLAVLNFQEHFETYGDPRRFDDYLEEAWSLLREQHPELDEARAVGEILAEEEAAGDTSFDFGANLEEEITEPQPQAEVVDSTGEEAQNKPPKESEDDKQTDQLGTDGTASLESQPAEPLQPTQAKRQTRSRTLQSAGTSQGSLFATDGSGGGSPAGKGTGAERVHSAAERGREAGGVGTGGGRGQSDGSVQSAPQPDTSRTDTQAPSASRITSNYRIRDLGALSAGGAKTKFRQNIAAIELLRKLEAEGRAATREEQDVLARYIGWGQFPQAFDAYNREWADEHAELKALLGDEGFAAARRSTLNAHYTSPEIVQAMWGMIEKLGFTGGRVLEPSMGVGNFFGLVPDHLLARSALTGVELDPTTGKIAKLLYPDENVQIKGFEKHAAPDGFYDIAIGNVPFGDYRVNDPAYNRFGANIHNYFFLKALDKVRPGGLVAFITSTGTMDSVKATKVREALAKKADLVAAMRLPENTFQKNAGTAVVTDLIILRKRLDDEAANGVAWVNLKTMPDPDGGDPIPINEYFADNPDQILGTLDRKSRLYGRGDSHVSRTDDFEKRFADAVERLPENLMQPAPKKGKAELKGLDAAGVTKDGGFTVQKGKVYVKRGDQLVEHAVDKKHVERLEKILAVRDAVREVFNSQLRGDSEEQNAAFRNRLNRAYDAFVKKYGFLNQQTNRRLIADDPDAPVLLALEKWDAKAKTATKADVFTKNTVRANARPQKAQTPAEALGISLNESGIVDIERIAQLLGVSEARAGERLVENELAFNDPKEGWQAKDIYLSGNVRRKLIEAQEAAAADPQFAANVRALERVQPEDIDYTDIDVRLGAPWVPVEDIQDFMAHLLGGERPDFQVNYIRGQGEWLVGYTTRGAGLHKGSQKESEIYGTRRAGFAQVLQAAMSDKPILIYDKVDAKTSKLNHEESAAAMAKVAEVREAFKDWVWTDDKRRARLHRYYNDNFNNIRLIKYHADHYRSADGSYTLPGMNPAISLRPHQANGVWQVVSTGRALYAHEVGTGKTFTMGAAAMELRRLGLAKKPAIAVPKAIIEGFVSDIRQLYPNARIITTEGKFEAANRKKTISQIATGDWDIVILTHDNLDMLPMRPEVAREFIQREMDELEAVIREAKELEAEQNGGRRKKDSRFVKQLEKNLARLQARLEDAIEGSHKDNAVFFEETGIDFLFVDEAHKYKSLPVYTTRSRIKGIPTSRSDRATNMLMRSRWLQEQNQGRGVVFATGTPVANTMVELYNLQRYLQYEELEERGITAFDAWANTFGETVTKMEYTVTGEYAPVTRFAKYTNLPELLQLSRQVMDVQRIDDMGTIQRPTKLEEVISVPMSEEQQLYLLSIRLRAEAMKKRKGPPQKGDDNMLKLSSDARKSAMDMRLVDFRARDDADNKATAVANKVLEIYRANPEKTQMIFSDLGVHATDWGFSMYGDIIKKLVEGGIARERIINFAQLTDAQKRDAVARLQSGEALIGVGSTDKLGTGVNAQKKLLALHHIDVPWLPAAVEQRDGRGWRQGNENKNIHVYRYVTTGSFDTFMWQVVDAKSRFIKQAMTGDIKERSFKDEDTEEMSPAKVMAIASGNPELLTKVQLDEDIAELERARKRHEQTQLRLKDTVASLSARADRLKKVARDSEADARLVEAQASQKEFVMNVAGKDYDERNEASRVLTSAALRAASRERVKVGEYRGFDLVKSGSELYLQRPNSESFHNVSINYANPENTVKSLEAVYRNIPGRAKKVTAEMALIQEDIEAAQSEIGKPFKRAEELATKKAELGEIVGRLRAAGREKAEPPVEAVVEGDYDAGDGETFGAVREAGFDGREDAGADSDDVSDPVRRPGRDVAAVGTLVSREGVGESDEPTGISSIRGGQNSDTGRGIRAGSGARTLGLAITAPLERDGRIDLRGQTVQSYEDLARLAQVFRDPRYETFRIIYVKGDQIVAHEAMTSRQPNQSLPFVSKKLLDSDRLSEVDEAPSLEAMHDRMRRLGADGYYLLHNHPSGDPTQSKADEGLTAWFEKKVRGFKGHIVINSKKYAVIEPGTVVADVVKTKDMRRSAIYVKKRPQPKVFDLDVEDNLLVASIPHDFLNRKVANHMGIAQLGKRLQTPNEFISVFYLDNRMKIQAIQEIPVALFKRTKEAADYIRGRKIAFGAPFVYTYTGIMGQEEQALHAAGDKLVNTEVITDHVWSEFGVGFRSGKTNYDPYAKQLRGLRVEEDVESAPSEAFEEGGIRERLREKIAARRAEEKRAGEAGVVRVGHAEKKQSTFYEFGDPETEARFQTAKTGVKDASRVDRFVETVKHFARLASRDLEHLPRTAEYSNLRFQLHRLEKVKGIASDKAIQYLHGVTVRMDARQADLFTKWVILSDLLEEATRQEAKGQEIALPFGFTPEKLVEDYSRFAAFVEAEPKVKQAYADRQAVIREVTREYLEAARGIGYEPALNREHYFHHQVLDKAREESQRVRGAGKKLKAPTGRGFLKERSGSELDINANYLQVEHSILSQMIADAAIFRLWKTVQDDFDIRPRLKAEARRANEAAIEEMIAKEQAKLAPQKKKEPRVSLSTFVRQQGKIKWSKHYSGELKRLPRSLWSTSGKLSPDYMREAAVEAGYLDPESEAGQTEMGFLSYLEYNGDTTFLPEPLHEQAEREIEAFLEQELTDDELRAKRFQEVVDRIGFTAAHLRLYKRRIAWGFEQLRELAKEGELWTGENNEYEQAAKSLLSHRNYDEPLSEKRQLFGYLGALAALEGDASKFARTILKAIGDRQRFLRERLGKDFKTFEHLIPETHQMARPRDGAILYKVHTVGERYVHQAVEEQLGQLGVPVEELRNALAIPQDAVRTAMAYGGQREGPVVPNEVAETLNSFGYTPEQRWLVRGIKIGVSKWKAWQLISPFRVVKYNVRNLSSDMDALIAGNPSSFTKVGRALRDLDEFLRQKKAPSKELALWMERGGFHDLHQVAENTGDIGGLAQFRNLAEKKRLFDDLGKLNVFKHIWKLSRISTDAREALFRYATFLDYLEQVKSGGKPKNYGASIPAEVRALTDPADQAYKLSNDLMGAYDEVTELGKQLSDTLMPFWRWQEVNAKRYYRLLRNAIADDKLAATVGRKLLSTAARSPIIALRVGRFGLKAMFLTAALSAFNHLLFDDEEEELPPEVRKRPHIIFGRDATGAPLYFSRLGAVTDLFEWVGIDGDAQFLRDYLNGRKTLKEIAEQMAIAPVNRLWQSLGPFKTGSELVMNKQTYPDVFNQRPIRDPWEFAADSLGLGDPYRHIRGRPTRGVGASVINLFLYRSDPGESAYNEIRSLKFEYLKKLGKPSPDASPTEKSNALYYLKQALRYEDEKAFRKYLAEYAALGGTPRGLQESIERMAPLDGLDEKTRSEFLSQLTAAERAQLARAEQFYATVIANDVGGVELLSRPIPKEVRAPVDKELKSLDLGVSFPENEFTVNKEKLKMPTERFKEFEQGAVEKQYSEANKLLAMPFYHNLTPEQKRKRMLDRMRDVLNRERDRAKSELRRETVRARQPQAAPQ